MATADGSLMLIGGPHHGHRETILLPGPQALELAWCPLCLRTHTMGMLDGNWPGGTDVYLRAWPTMSLDGEVHYRWLDPDRDPHAALAELGPPTIWATRPSA